MAAHGRLLRGETETWSSFKQGDLSGHTDEVGVTVGEPKKPDVLATGAMAAHGRPLRGETETWSSFKQGGHCALSGHTDEVGEELLTAVQSLLKQRIWAFILSFTGTMPWTRVTTGTSIATTTSQPKRVVLRFFQLVDALLRGVGKF